MKTNFFILLIFVLAVQGVSAQRKLTEATIYYDVVINTSNENPKAADMLDGATSIIYIKGAFNRSDFISSLGSQSTIYDGKAGTAVNIREYGNKKFMITYTAKEWKTANKKYDGITYKFENVYKTISGYKCQKAVGSLTDGTAFTVYFTRDLIPVNSDFQYFNKNLPGLAMQYDASRGDRKVTYTVSNIEFSAVPLAKFDIPKSGFRSMSYSQFRKSGAQ